MNRKYTLASLFSGCGGMDLGFFWEGFEILWANDIDSQACKTYRGYFRRHVVENGVVRELPEGQEKPDHMVEGDVTDPEKVKLDQVPKVNVITGGFPCQDFSMIWKRGGIETERGNLYRYLLKTVTAVQPAVFIAENVKGLLSANNKKAIQQIISDFDAAGYYVGDPHLVDFAEYGVAQHRERVLIIGVRKSIPISFDIPLPTHRAPNFKSAKQALEGAKDVPFNNEHQNISPKTAERLRLIPPGGNFTDIPKDSPYYVKGMISHVYRRLHPDEPSTTIIAGGGGGTWGYHYEEHRPLTNRERARLFGYPDDFVFQGSISEVRRQIGNSVPPEAIRPFAKAIKEFLDQLSETELNGTGEQQPAQLKHSLKQASGS